MLIQILLLIAGLFLLFYGSEWLVKGAASVAVSFSIRPVVIGLTIVAFATSAPELLVSLLASVKGSSGLSVGNIIGSNVINIALVLGISAVVTPVRVNRKIIKKELPFTIAVSFLFWFMCMDGKLGYVDGIILLSILVIFLIYGLLTAKDSKAQENSPEKPPALKYILYITLIVAGLFCLGYGAHLVVKSSIYLARFFGLSEVFIGLSVVALGTSLPELATSAVASARGENDISIGNVVGSNLFNICLVMGTVGVLGGIEIDTRLHYLEFPFMIFMSLALYLIALFKGVLSRRSGIFLILSFTIYIFVSYYYA